MTIRDTNTLLAIFGGNIHYLISKFTIPIRPAVIIKAIQKYYSTACIHAKVEMNRQNCISYNTGGCEQLYCRDVVVSIQVKCNQTKVDCA